MQVAYIFSPPPIIVPAPYIASCGQCWNHADNIGFADAAIVVIAAITVAVVIGFIARELGRR